MAKNSTSRILEEIKNRCNIIDEISKVVPLKKTGNNHKGLCPFHSEDTPSFIVSESKQLFTCFGCNVSGDVIEFVKKYYNLDFIGAVEKLAKENGIEVDRGFSSGSVEKTKYYNINREAALYFCKLFFKSKNPALTYMTGRGLSIETLKRFGIGYGGIERTGLYNHLTSKGYEVEDILTLGLISESNGEYYDKFRGRVIFPIMNTGGKVIGFGARLLEKSDRMPKYLNSAESFIFLKKNNLYGLNFSRQDIGREGKAILVEGYMDMISLYQSGIKNAVASLGTALTSNQGRLIKRYTEHVVVSYDGDAAGQAATLRGLDILYGEGLKVSVIGLKGEKDPDEFVKAHGKAEYIKLVDSALPFIEYKLSLLERDHDLSTPEGKHGFLTKSAEVLKVVDPIEADIHLENLAKKTEVSKTAIERQYLNIISQEKQRPVPPGTRYREPENLGIVGDTEEIFIRLMCYEEVFYKEIISKDDLFYTTAGTALSRAIQQVYNPDSFLDIRILKDSLSPEALNTFERILKDVRLGENPGKTFNQAKVRNQLRLLDNQRQTIQNNLKIAEDEGNEAVCQRLMIESQDISRKIQNLKLEL